MGLVNTILTTLATDFNGCEYACFTDRAGEQLDRRCRPVSGFVPDVYAVAVRDAEMRTIGEAKSSKDLLSAHTPSQLRAFLRHLVIFERPTLVVAVPFGAITTACSIMHGLLEPYAARVRAVVVAPHFSRVVSNGWRTS